MRAGSLSPSGTGGGKTKLLVVSHLQGKRAGIRAGGLRAWKACNKTEMLLGYGTIFGDMAHAINPIGDLYKTQVWQLAEFVGVPERIVKKKPSADLWAGQTDEQELGYTYEEIDRVLYLLVDQKMKIDEVVSSGFGPKIVNDMHGRIIRSQFKRTPPSTRWPEAISRAQTMLRIKPRVVNQFGLAFLFPSQRAKGSSSPLNHFSVEDGMRLLTLRTLPR